MSHPASTRYGKAREKIRSATGREGYSALVENSPPRVSMTLAEYERLANAIEQGHAAEVRIDRAERAFTKTRDADFGMYFLSDAADGEVI